MNFTREPIIETVITPRDGYRLLLRSSKAADREEHSVEAVEVVSFGHSFFYRSLERSKPFLIPLSDYELVEHREVRVQLHNAPPDRAIKISGGRQPRESSDAYEDENAPAGDSQGRREGGKRRPRRRRSGRGDRPMPATSQHAGEPQQDQSEEFEGSHEAPPAAPQPPPMSRLIPPPSTLIKETIGRYKTTDEFSPPPFPPHEGREEAAKENNADDNDLL